MWSMIALSSIGHQPSLATGSFRASELAALVS